MSGADDIAKTIQARLVECFDLFNKKQYEALGRFYTESSTVMAMDESPLVGAKAIVESELQSSEKSCLPFSVLEFVGTEFFELLDDQTAYTIYLAVGKDDEGKSVMFYHQSILWKCVNGQWYMEIEVYNETPAPSSTSQEDVKKHIQGRISALCDACNKDDLEGVLDIYVENPTVVPHRHPIARGKRGITELYKVVIPQMKKLVVDELYSFEMINDFTVHTTSHMFTVDENGKVKAAFRECMLWAKQNGEWFIRMNTCNPLPTPKE